MITGLHATQLCGTTRIHTIEIMSTSLEIVLLRIAGSWYLPSRPPPGETLVGDRRQFNSKLSRARVISEHTIGLLKGRFPWLCSIRKVISEDPETLRDILGLIDACVILHNFLVMQGLEEKEEELYQDDDVTVIDDYERLPQSDELMQKVPVGSPGDHRRTQLLFYLKERGLI